MTRVARALTAALGLLLAPLAARADYHLRSLYGIGLGEFEIEHNGDAIFDRRPDQRQATSYTIEFGTGLTSWWNSQVELGFDRAPGAGEPTLLTALVTENIFQLTEPGEYLLDAGFYFEYAQSLTTERNAAANAITFGPIVGKDIGRTTHTLNLFFTRQVGPDQTSQRLDANFAWQSRWNVWDRLSPAIEIYGNPGGLGNWPRLERQQLLVGPVGLGVIRLNDVGIGHAGRIKYELGWLFGTTQASANGILRWRLEVEIPF